VAARRSTLALDVTVRYRDGQDVRAGDVVELYGKHRGTVVGCIPTKDYLEPHSHEQWGYLGDGVMVDTDFGGLVHFTGVETDGDIVLLNRAGDV
jgi:hypothetical protein